MTHPGGQAWYDGLIQHLADPGVDFFKYEQATQLIRSPYREGWGL
ncbi:hypothetical protein ACFL6U_01455 [Planctomycetota bacterium]